MENNENDVSSDPLGVNCEQNDEHFDLENVGDGINFVLVNQRVDYEFRSKLLKNVCLYDFLSQYRKKKMDETDEKHIQIQAFK